MSKLRYSTSISLDGLTAGRDQSAEHPLGVGGRALHDWTKGERPSSRVLEEDELGVGALIMGRNMFGGGPGPWGREPWEGWWGPNPPFHLPVFVLTHHPRPKLECEGGTTFSFVTDGLGTALAQASTQPAVSMSISAGARPSRRSTSPPGCSTRSSSTSFRFSSAQASACSTAKRSTRSSSSRPLPSKRPASHISNTVCSTRHGHDGRRDECEDEIAG